MPALFFPNVNALRLALLSGLVPPEVSRTPAAAGFDAQGRLWLETAELPPRENLAALARMGVQALGGTGVPTARVSCWAELLPLRPSTDPPPGPVLFLVPDRVLAQFVARLRRAHSGPTGIAVTPTDPPGVSWVSVRDAPAALLAESLEPGCPAEAFAEQAPGVWARVGWRHPIPDHLPVPPGRVLLIRPPRSLVAVPDRVPSPTTDEFPLPALPAPARPPAPAVSIPVRLWLSPRPARGRESLWVLDEDAGAAFWDFCDGADERLLRRLDAAPVGSGEGRRLVVRSTGKKGAPALPLAAGFAPEPRVAGLFVPADRQLRPRLRVQELTRVLGLAPGRVVWLETGSDGGVVPHAVEEVAFRPLPELIEYTRPPTGRLTVEQAVQRFPLPGFQPPCEPLALPEEDADAAPPGVGEARAAAEGVGREPGWIARALRGLVARLRTVREGSPPAPPQRPHANPAPGAERSDRSLASPDALLHGHDWAVRRRELEARLFRDLPHLGPTGRAERWADLAGVYSATGNAQDAAVCWMNAVWESPVAPAAWLEHWLAHECRAARLPAGRGALERWLSEPGRPGVGRVAAAYTALVGSAAAPPAEFVSTLPRILVFLDQHFDDLPVRAAWLARLVAARACAGDALGLARWRDRVLARLSDRGPGLDLDEPSFLRFHGTATAEQFQTAREWLVRARESALKWVQDQATGGDLATGGGLRSAGLDPETESTAAYAQFMFAWGLGCLGERTRAKDWAGKARKIVARAAGPGVDPAVHAVLGDLFLFRIKEVQEGRPAKAELPADLTARIDRLSESDRYAVNRLREHARILEPLATVRAHRGQDLKVFWGTDLLGERLSVLAARAEHDHVADEAEALLRLCAENPTTTTVPRIVLTLLEVAPRLRPAAMTRAIDLLPDALDWLEAWLAAGPWPDDERSGALVVYQSRMIARAFTGAGAFPAELVGPATGALVRRLVAAGDALRLPLLSACAPAFRCLHRLALHGEAENLVRHLDVRLADGEILTPAPARLGLAAGWYTAGNEEEAKRFLDEARDRLFLAGNLKDASRTNLALAYAETLGFAPSRIAHGRLEELFQRLGKVKITGATNRYYTLQPLRIVDTVVRAVVTDEFALGSSVRGWLDDDEFLIRSRIHRDLTAVLREQGIG
jgi:hypothetical protein